MASRAVAVAQDPCTSGVSAVVDRPLHREHLCRMFWELPGDSRGALRCSLSKIRQIVNIDGCDALVADRDTIALRGQSITPRPVAHREDADRIGRLGGEALVTAAPLISRA
jgi:hypothetical protein